MNPNRIKNIKAGIGGNGKKNYIIYWMQQSQRVYYNHALVHAVNVANEKKLPLLVYFGLTPNYPDANARHYYFMLEGLSEVKKTLNSLKISFVLKIGSPEKTILSYLENADTLIMDYGYLNYQKRWRQFVWDYANRHFNHLTIDLIDTDMIVPVDIVSTKAEYGAYTLRPKLHQLYQEYRDYDGLDDVLNTNRVNVESDDELNDIDRIIDQLAINKSVSRSSIYKGGYSEAKNWLFNFLDNHINLYPISNDPGVDHTSKLSLYLHFGQISSLEILDNLIERYHRNEVTLEAYLSFFEQLLVRRELAFNYVTYQKGYDHFMTMTEPWAYITMNNHQNDLRDYIYSIEDYISFGTHDKYFNTAMKEMVYTGYMHNYMRMYWAKKIIEWSPIFEEAYNIIKTLNNTYFIDGRDANSYAGIAWCFGKHDRAWTERLVFGKLRYMNSSGLERKFDMKSYIERINKLINFSS